MGVVLSRKVGQRQQVDPRVQLRSMSSNFGRQSPYDLLKVDKSATDKEIKLAYFREAKKYHPDLNPNDPTAKAKFQRVAAAYEILSDPGRRRTYDFTGSTADSGSAEGQQQQSAEDVFNSVREDFDVVKDALSSYGEEVKDELEYAVDCAKNGDWPALWDLAQHHKVLILGVVLPTVVFLRYPPAVLWVLRATWAVGNVMLLGLLRSGNMGMAARVLWQNIVKLSNEQRKRASKRNRRK
mmetsp:Transcript_12005/g.26943  ORF Transcript_12005/g.26943 Transcript_12005/m.26943 type:complete len:239 (-) Transcript_12005:216-932(-)